MIASQRYNALPLDYRNNMSHLFTALTYDKRLFFRALKDIFKKKFNFGYFDLVNNKLYEKFDYEILFQDKYDELNTNIIKENEESQESIESK
eukprot:Pgem_evm14s8721